VRAARELVLLARPPALRRLILHYPPPGLLQAVSLAWPRPARWAPPYRRELARPAGRAECSVGNRNVAAKDSGMRRLVTAVALAAALVAGAGGSALAATASGDSPAGFWYGTDSTQVTVGGSVAPYSEPALGGAYGGYAGMAGDWAKTEGCKPLTKPRSGRYWR
jgi:hypothetical protein